MPTRGRSLSSTLWPLHCHWLQLSHLSQRSRPPHEITISEYLPMVVAANRYASVRFRAAWTILLSEGVPHEFALLLSLACQCALGVNVTYFGRPSCKVTGS